MPPCNNCCTPSGLFNVALLNLAILGSSQTKLRCHQIEQVTNSITNIAVPLKRSPSFGCSGPWESAGNTVTRPLKCETNNLSDVSFTNCPKFVCCWFVSQLPLLALLVLLACTPMNNPPPKRDSLLPLLATLSGQLFYPVPGRHAQFFSNLSKTSNLGCLCSYRPQNCCFTDLFVL